MSTYLSVICALWLVAMTALAPAQAGELKDASYRPASAADTLFHRTSSKPCCFNDGEYFHSTPKTCRRYGGRVVAYEYCQRQYYRNDEWDYRGKPCCYNNGQYFNSSPRNCRRYGGRPARQEYCEGYYQRQWGDDRDDQYSPNAEKPCCYNDGRYFHTTPKTCRKYGGQVVELRYCLRQQYR